MLIAVFFGIIAWTQALGINKGKGENILSLPLGAEGNSSALVSATNGLKFLVPHDDDVNECDSTQPLPPKIENGPDGHSRLYPGARVIVDIGGNVGNDIEKILENHPKARIYTFEPTPDYFSMLKARFGKDPRVTISNTGASKATGDAEFIMEGNHGVGTSGMDHTLEGEHVVVHLQDIDKILKDVQRKIGDTPDVVTINCEGCEYDVMQRIVDQGWLGKIEFIQLSWHMPADVMDRVAKRCKIERALWRHYDRTHFGKSGWVGWTLRKNVKKEER